MGYQSKLSTKRQLCTMLVPVFQYLISFCQHTATGGDYSPHFTDKKAMVWKH